MPEENKREYRGTLNLPRTDFAMRAELPKREPERIRWWIERDTYRRRLERNRGNTPWVLHDGPPYANGELHMGTFLNRVLKDAFVKIALLDGKFAEFIPGWDMHGLPIERETLLHLGLDFRTADPIELRAKCRERALYWLGRQRDQMLRMGQFGRWDDPYMTIHPTFEATIVETLADLAEREQLYKGLRSTLWCVHDETALAEAEIEYKDHTSPSIYVRFPAADAQRAAILERVGVANDGAPLAVAIWTTTPWTLPANVAVALRADATYGVYRVGGEDLIVADALAAEVLHRLDPELDVAAARRGGGEGRLLDRLAVRHPFLPRESALVLAEYVELATGTGAVHTAPGHGVDDFNTGAAYGLPVLNPVDAAGRFTAEAGPYAGQFIFDANARIIEDLRSGGMLIASEAYEHSYPHCWRCKNPVVFRATAQWFIGLDRNGLRERAMRATETVGWLPEWGEGRMRQMIENHPEWCISRQRVWGTPIPSVTCTACNEALLDPRLARNVAAAFRKRTFEQGNASDLWWTEPLETFAPPDLRCPHCGGTSFEKERNIVDIWFESGVTWRAVLVERGTSFPADCYLEGGDQYRGWFRSNLITAVAVRDVAPYKEVVSHGWVVDAEGRAMHKSAGNYIAADEAIAKYGADVLRLWVASIEFTQDARVGALLLENVSKVYRNLRNRLRYFLSNLYDLTPQSVVAPEHMTPLDRLALAAVAQRAHAVVRAYREHRLHDGYVALVELDEELSALYVDAVKDPLYTDAPASHRRRSRQSCCLEILRTLCVLLAPILSFTAEEAWQAVSPELRGERSSVFDLSFPETPHVAQRDPAVAADLALWDLLRTWRARIAAGDEGARDFQLAAVVEADDSAYAALAALGDDLREALMVSELRLERTNAPEPQLRLQSAATTRCERCRKYLPPGSDPDHPDICAPCTQIVRELELGSAAQATSA